MARLAFCGVADGGCGGLQGSAAEGGGRGCGVDPWVVPEDCEGAGTSVQRGGEGAYGRGRGVESPELSGYSAV